MAIFGKKKTEETKEVEVKKTKTTSKKTTVKKEKAPKKEKAVKTEAVEATTSTANATASYSYRVTEKGTLLSSKDVFVLNVPKSANKIDLKKDIEKKYKVTVININIVNSPKKTKVYRGRLGLRGGGKKAYITLKKGDSIVL